MKQAEKIFEMFERSTAPLLPSIRKHLVHKIFDREFDITQDTAWITVVPDTCQERGEYPVHLKQLEIKVADAQMSEFTITCLERHQVPSATSCSRCSRLVA